MGRTRGIGIAGVALASVAVGCGIDALGTGPLEIVTPAGDLDSRDASLDRSGGGEGGGEDAADGDAAVLDAASSDGGGDAPPGVDAGPCATCPAGTAQAMCIANACVAARRVFVSSNTSTANLGGIAGADARCQALATAALLGGTWRAWVSSNASSPSSRFTKATVAYRLVDGTIVANDWTDLTNGSLQHAIDRDEKNVLTTNSEVWTATTTSGAFQGGGCDGFASGASGSPTAAQGISDRTNGQWTNVYVQF